MREEEQRRQRAATGESRPRRNGADVGTGPLCPADATHGRLFSWTTGSQWDFYCGHEAHEGFRFYVRSPGGEAVKR